ncbi:ATP phosphoribosyltransferase regulatory subunit, partial [Candidatus Gracilibacteria bacterium]|nr:ATP phosphoribosyltransferase regulatory subunit [Candidatus Gracilibacteria bacterium]
MRDVLPADQREILRVRAALEALVAEHGFAFLDLPIIEHRDLYMRKLGEELVGKVYEFTYGQRELALRPEWTASVLRAYVAHLQDQPLPLRVAYSGPVFRYERPQRLTYRQFTQVGVELVGGPAPRADAEVLALACAGLDAVGIANYEVVIGHVGLIRAALAGLALSERTRGILIWSMERMRQQGVDGVRARLAASLGEAPDDFPLPDGLDDEEAAQLLLRVFRATQVDLNSGTRSPEAIVARLLRKLQRGDEQPAIEQALGLLAPLVSLRGAPALILPQAEALLRQHTVPIDALAELQAVLALLKAHGVRDERLVIDFGLGRGLHYYTGLIFEIYDAEQLQLVGGGRYDDLVSALGGRQATAAAGFAYGLERVVAAALRSAAPREAVVREVLVAAVGESSYAYALHVANTLRQHGFVVSVDVRDRSVSSNLRDAAPPQPGLSCHRRPRGRRPVRRLSGAIWYAAEEQR